jgi:hypothetical protein
MQLQVALIRPPAQGQGSPTAVPRSAFSLVCPVLQPARGIMAELFGKKTGICRGQGGSMHMFSSEWGLVRSAVPTRWDIS